MLRLILFALALLMPNLASAQATAMLPLDLSIYATKAEVPTGSVTSPPCIGDAGSAGTPASGIYAMWNHTHCSKTRRGIVSTNAAGLVTVTFSPVFAGSPVCVAQADPPMNTTDVINAQGEGDPTTTAATFRVTRTQQSVVALIGLTVLSVPASVGVTKVHYLCIEP